MVGGFDVPFVVIERDCPCGDVEYEFPKSAFIIFPAAISCFENVVDKLLDRVSHSAHLPRGKGHRRSVLRLIMRGNSKLASTKDSWPLFPFVPRALPGFTPTTRQSAPLRRIRTFVLARDVRAKLTKLLGEDNLIGSSGEFGLLFAFLGRGPRTKELDGEPALSFEDVRTMFLDKRLPDAWESWKKLRIDWVAHTASLIVSAERQYRKA